MTSSGTKPAGSVSKERAGLSQQQQVDMAELTDFTPRYFIALQIWLLAGVITVTTIWLEGYLSGAIPLYQRIGGMVLGPSLLGLAIALLMKREWVKQIVVLGWIMLSGFIYVGYIYAMVEGPWTQGYIIFSNLTWGCLLFIYIAMFMDRQANKVAWSHTLILTTLAIACMARFVSMPPAASGEMWKELQPYIFTVIISWTALGATSAIRWLYDAMIESTQKAALMRGTILAMVGHELRTQMQAMFNQIELAHLMSSMEDSDKQRILGTLEGLKQTVLQMQNVLENTSSAMKGRDITTTPTSESFDALDLIMQIKADFMKRSRAKGLSLVLDRTRPLPREVVGDRTRLTQILNNLVGNAIKYSDSGQITIRLVSLNKDRCLLSVEDQGAGIAPDELSSIFKPFVRGSADGIAEIEGTGLGLSIVQRETEAMGGHVYVESTVNVGSKFTVELPLTVKSFYATKKATLSRRVLAIGEFEVGAMDALLGNDEIHIAKGSEEAVALLKSTQFDMVIFDLSDETKSPTWIARELRSGKAVFETQNAAVIGMVDSANVPDVQRSALYNFIAPKASSITASFLDSFMVAR